jgi:hypothetical protein
MGGKVIALQYVIVFVLVIDAGSVVTSALHAEETPAAQSIATTAPRNACFTDMDICIFFSCCSATGHAALF